MLALPESDVAFTVEDLLLVNNGIVVGKPSIDVVGTVPTAVNAIFAVVAVSDDELLGLMSHASQEVLEAADGEDTEVLRVERSHAELNDSIAILMAMSLQHSVEGERELVVALDDIGLDTVILLHEVGLVRGRDDEHDERNIRHALDAVEVFDGFGLVVVIVGGGVSVAHVVGVWFWVSSTSAAHRDW